MTKPMPEYRTVCCAVSCNVSCRKKARVMTVVARTDCNAVLTSRNGKTRRSPTRILGGRPAACACGGPSSGRKRQMVSALTTASAAEK